MVNFEDTNTFTRNKKEIQELITLQRRYETINALREYKRSQYKNGEADERRLIELQAELTALYYEIDSMIDKDLQETKKNKTYNNIEELEIDIESTDDTKVLKAWNYINKLLYRKHLTQIDSQKQIDWSDPEEVNEEHEL